MAATKATLAKSRALRGTMEPALRKTRPSLPPAPLRYRWRKGLHMQSTRVGLDHPLGENTGSSTLAQPASPACTCGKPPVQCRCPDLSLPRESRGASRGYAHTSENTWALIAIPGQALCSQPNFDQPVLLITLKGKRRKFSLHHLKQTAPWAKPV